MTNMLVKSAIALSLGVACGPAFAQTAECPAGTECPQPGSGAEQGMQPDAQGGAAGQESQAQQPGTDAAQQEGQAGAETQQEGQAGAETQQQPESEGQQQEGQAGAKEQQPGAESQQTQESQGTEQTTEQKTDVDVTVEQKTEITQVIREQKVEPIDVDFDVSVGTAVPETIKVKLQPVPQRIVQIVPAYEGYLFFVLADGRIVIVNPSTLQIVLIIA
ncbi:DUF1236 domain-containing protein [Ensifer sp. LCM 4579]|uniref:DUF1236 domain-containing protein n=1 Tax=Ensifer sp. LCM 4579 TaxID=1848292 RepID=UPI0008D96778|nr:DUF1236 domain-containing protein [Ensifer sp. LCM 4579]OHV72788.1 hypothetical protein LCM4579_11900 [Ensifer sp. LCM 4579]